MCRAGFLLAALGIFLIGGWLRFAEPTLGPLHADESTGARIVGRLLDGEEHRFDPTHFHGPLLARAGEAAARSAGFAEWKTLEIPVLRAVAATAGLGLVLLALASAPLLGNSAALFSAALLAVSPLLTHYSRLFLHEPLFAFFLGAALLSLGAWWVRPSLAWAVVAGIFLGFSAATRETFVIPVFSWLLAAVLLRFAPPGGLRHALPHAAAAIVAAVITAVLWYSEFGARWEGVPDFISTYWRYETTPGHDKPIYYYLGLLMDRHAHGRLWWWFGAPMLLSLAAWFPCRPITPSLAAARFFFLSGAIQLLIFSLISYKVPWLMFVPVAHFCMAAGIVAGDALMKLIRGMPQREPADG